jgi:hypothetical protein
MGRQSAGGRALIGGHRANGWASPRVHWDSTRAAYARGVGSAITRDHKALLVIVPGTFEVIWLGDAWLTRAESALSRARKACDWERDNYIESAGDAWRDIFRLEVPRVPW